MVIRDPVPEVQFRDELEEADTPIVLHARHARRNYSVMHSDTVTLRLWVMQDEMEQKLTELQYGHLNKYK